MSDLKPATEQKACVLVVDDDASIVELMRDFLEADGFAVETARDARAATTILERGPVDCVLLDVMMPGQTGFDLCRRMRETRDVPILFLSARDADVDKIRGLGLGGDDYIVKSATPAEVVARVKAVLRGGGQRLLPPVRAGRARGFRARAGPGAAAGRSVLPAGVCVRVTASKRAAGGASRGAAGAVRAGAGVAGVGAEDGAAAYPLSAGGGAGEGGVRGAPLRSRPLGFDTCGLRVWR
jgi:CheY-like chemotaxis protein